MLCVACRVLGTGWDIIFISWEPTGMGNNFARNSVIRGPNLYPFKQQLTARNSNLVHLPIKSSKGAIYVDVFIILE